MKGFNNPVSYIDGVKWVFTLTNVKNASHKGLADAHMITIILLSVNQCYYTILDICKF